MPVREKSPEKPLQYGMKGFLGTNKTESKGKIEILTLPNLMMKLYPRAREEDRQFGSSMAQYLRDNINEVRNIVGRMPESLEKQQIIRSIEEHANLKFN